MRYGELIGRTISGVKIAKDKKAVRFDFADGGGEVYLTDGDCCSESWVESIDDVEALIGGTVRAVEDLSLGEHTHDGDSVAFYGLKIMTDKGYATLDYRNASNGYYGGSLVRKGHEYFDGGVFGQNKSKEEWGDT